MTNEELERNGLLAGMRRSEDPYSRRTVAPPNYAAGSEMGAGGRGGQPTAPQFPETSNMPFHVKPNVQQIQQVGVTTPTRIAPTDVNEDAFAGDVPEPTSINGGEEELPATHSEDAAQTTASTSNVPKNSAPKKEKSAASNLKKKSNPKTVLIAVVCCMVFVGGIILLAMGKSGKKPSILPKTGTQTSDTDPITLPDYEDPFDLSGEDWIVEKFHYSNSALAELRRVGYTAAEIELFESQEADWEALVKDAETKRREYLEETARPFYEARSDEFKALEDSTWVGLAEVSDDMLPGSASEIDLVTYTEKTINTDYEKVPPRGHQLFIKIYIDKSHSDWIYHMVSLSQWNALENSGNLVVTVNINTFNSDAGTYTKWDIESITIY